MTSPRFPNPARGTGPPGFTMVELLVVISVIAILMGILLPVFSGVRETARKTECVHQLAQFIQATTMYAADFGGPGEFFPVSPVEHFGPENLKSSYVIQGPGKNEPIKVRHGLFYDCDQNVETTTDSLVDDPSMYACPSTDAEFEPEDFTKLIKLSSSYWWLNGDHEEADRVSELTINDPPSPYPFYWDRHGNHEGGVNAAYRDGHAGWLEGEFGPPQSVEELRDILKALREAGED